MKAASEASHTDLATSGKLARACRPVLRWSTATLNMLFPPQCVFCHEEFSRHIPQTKLCDACRFKLQPLLGPLCQKCATPLPPSLTADICVRCQRRRVRFASVHPLGFYAGELQQAVLRMKKSREEPLSLAVGKLLAQQLAEQLSIKKPDLIVPVPMHWTRRLARGTNSPELLAEPLSDRLKVPVLSDILYYRRNVKKQGTLSSRERFRNVRGAFRVSSGYDIRSSCIILVDDVMTTGATAGEAARMLRDAGATRVVVAVVARAAGNY